MDSAASKAIANQKVFVPLSAVLDVAANLSRLASQADEQVNGSAATKAHVRGMVMVIKSLGLPINIPSGYDRF